VLVRLALAYSSAEAADARAASACASACGSSAVSVGCGVIASASMMGMPVARLWARRTTMPQTGHSLSRCTVRNAQHSHKAWRHAARRSGCAPRLHPRRSHVVCARSAASWAAAACSSAACASSSSDNSLSEKSPSASASASTCGVAHGTHSRRAPISSSSCSAPAAASDDAIGSAVDAAASHAPSDGSPSSTYHGPHSLS
jgi:hypothetical protein